MDKRMTRRIVLSLTTVALLPATAFAHTGVMEASGMVAGLLHPLSGADHLLAMVAVGLWAAQLGGRASLAVPAAFVTLVAVGGALGFAGVALPFVEQWLMLSLLLLGTVIAVALKLSARNGAILVGMFALFHGFAHGSEIADGTAHLPFAVGFVLMTALLHAAGWSLGSLMQRMNLSLLHRLSGAGIALYGGVLAYAQI